MATIRSSHFTKANKQFGYRLEDDAVEAVKASGESSASTRALVLQHEKEALISDLRRGGRGLEISQSSMLNEWILDGDLIPARIVDRRHDQLRRRMLWYDIPETSILNRRSSDHVYVVNMEVRMGKEGKKGNRETEKKWGIGSFKAIAGNRKLHGN